MTPGETLRNRLLAFRRKPSVLPSTSTSTSTSPNPPGTPQRFPGTLQFATLITMPSLQSSKLYNTTPVNTSCSSVPNPSSARPPVPSDGAHRHTNATVAEVPDPVPGPGVPYPPAAAAGPEAEGSSFLSTLHIGVCTKPLTLDASLIPSPPQVPSPSGAERARRDVPLHPMFRIGYAGGAGVMIVDAPPRRSRDEQDEGDWNQVWMWRGF